MGRGAGDSRYDVLQCVLQGIFYGSNRLLKRFLGAEVAMEFDFLVWLARKQHAIWLGGMVKNSQKA